MPQVSIIRCRDYNPQNIGKASDTFNLAGGDTCKAKMVDGTIKIKNNKEGTNYQHEKITIIFGI
jgi:hypothetical protein